MPRNDVDWMEECLKYYMSAHNRLPTTIDMLAWLEAVSSVRMEHD